MFKWIRHYIHRGQKIFKYKVQDSLIRFKARWYINEGDGKTKILMLNEFTEEALR